MGQDTPLNDMLVLLNLARGRKARRILEVGTYRARTTYALHLNCPEAAIVSYDIAIQDSPFRRELLKAANVQLRNASFVASAETLRKEARFDFIFVDASHRFEQFQGMSEKPLNRCPQCVGAVRRMIGWGAAIIVRDTPRCQQPVG